MISLVRGDCLDVLEMTPSNSFESCVTDPPYHLTSIVKRFGAPNAAPAKIGATGAFARASRGFMGKLWDGGDVAFQPLLWAEVLRVLKPGAHLIAFGGTRTYHRLAVAIEDAGFEIRDQLAWVYGSGFPKSHNLDDDWAGWGTALKPAWEPIVLARKPLIGTVVANVLAHGTGAINIGACRVEAEDAEAGRKRHGGGVAFAEGVCGFKQDAITESPAGRFPANLCHDGSPEVLAGFPEAGGSGSAARFFYCAKASKKDRAGSKHPTVKPVALMRWLVRLVTPPDGTVLDLFAGSGTTGEAAALEGFKSVLIEKETEYQADILRRISQFQTVQDVFA